MNILETITERTRERIAEEKRNIPLTEIRTRAEQAAQTETRKRAEQAAQTETRKRAEQAAQVTQKSAAKKEPPCAKHCEADLSAFLPFEAALRAPGLSFICEVKKASPSKGLIAPDFPYLNIARDYEAAGAAAISCLTEPYWFKGSDRYLEEIVSQVSIPVLRKDFTYDEYMIYQAKALGASAILLICSVLDDAQLKAFHSLAWELGLSALVETHSEEEIERAQRIGASIIGVNNRNLKDFTVDIQNSIRLRKLVDSDTVFVSESGITGAKDMRALYENGTDAVLIGELLMRSGDRRAALAALKMDVDLNTDVDMGKME